MGFFPRSACLAGCDFGCPRTHSDHHHADMPIEEALQSIVDGGELVGTVALIWRNGEVVHSSSTGWQDQVGGRPMRRDTLFRIASMTKPVTTVAAIMLHEEGRFELDDPITEWAPEFQDMSVLRERETGDETTPASRAITFADLLSHRSGITYADFQHGPLSVAYTE